MNYSNCSSKMHSVKEKTTLHANGPSDPGILGSRHQRQCARQSAFAHNKSENVKEATAMNCFYLRLFNLVVWQKWTKTITHACKHKQGRGSVVDILWFWIVIRGRFGPLASSHSRATRCVFRDLIAADSPLIFAQTPQPEMVSVHPARLKSRVKWHLQKLAK